MASAAVGVKRSFSTIGDEEPLRSSVSRYADPEALASRPKHGIDDEAASSASGVHATGCDTSVPTARPGNSPRKFDPNASVVLIGMRGAGKSTLAVIASIAYRRRVVDSDDLFQKATGFSTAKYRKQFGAANHNLRQEELLEAMLRLHNHGAIIVCNGSSLERNGQLLMQDFARTHPVVHVVRDLHSIHTYLGGVDLQRLEEMIAFTDPIVRRCSNFEFFNTAEMAGVGATVPPPPGFPPTSAFLTLKRTQRTFLRFLSPIINGQSWRGPAGTTIPRLEPGYPLSDVPTELRRYTCAVQVPLPDILAEDVDMQHLGLGADAFEIVVESIQVGLDLRNASSDMAHDISACVSKVRRGTIVPIIINFVLAIDRDDDCSPYVQSVRHGLRTAPDFVTVDLSLADEILDSLIESRGITKVIGCLHVDRSWNDPFWKQQYERAVRLGCVLVRFSCPAESTDDDYFIHKMRFEIGVQQSPVPLTCYNTGKNGRRSVCFSKYLTPVRANPKRIAIPATLQPGPQTPWVTAREVTQALHASFTVEPMQLSIIGASLGYSVSPAMHNAAFEACGMPHRLVRVQSSSLNHLKELVREASFGGSIVIQPHKVEVIALTDSLSQHARAIGAVNTLIPVRNLTTDGSVPSDVELFQERGQSGPVRALYGENTEWIGIRSCVQRGLSPANAVRQASCGLVIGAGGMARAAVYALLQLGLKNIVIFNRTLGKAEKLVAHFKNLIVATTEAHAPISAMSQGNDIAFHVLESRIEGWPSNFRQPTIILSCIPADPIDDGPAAQFTLPTPWMRSTTGGVVMEMAYKTLNTPLMQQVREQGSMWTYMDGLDFIPEQAFAQFELFTGRRAPRRVMREEALRAWRDEQGNADPEMVQRRLRIIDEQEP